MGLFNFFKKEKNRENMKNTMNTVKNAGYKAKENMMEYTIVAKKKAEPSVRKTINTTRRNSGKAVFGGLVTGAVLGRAAYEAVKTGDLSGAGEYLSTLGHQIQTVTPKLIDGSVAPQDYFAPRAELALAGAGAAAGAEVIRKATHEKRNFNKRNVPALHYKTDELENGVAVISPKLAEKFKISNKLSVQDADGNMRTYSAIIQEGLDNLEIYTKDELGDSVKVAPTSVHVKQKPIKLKEGYQDGISYAMARTIQADAKIGDTMFVNLEDTDGKTRHYRLPVIEGKKKVVEFENVPHHRYASLEPSKRNYVTPKTHLERGKEYAKPKIDAGVAYTRDKAEHLRNHADDVKKNFLYKAGSVMESTGKRMVEKSGKAYKKDLETETTSDFADQLEYFLERTA